MFTWYGSMKRNRIIEPIFCKCVVYDWRKLVLGTFVSKFGSMKFVAWLVLFGNWWNFPDRWACIQKEEGFIYHGGKEIELPHFWSHVDISVFGLLTFELLFCIDFTSMQVKIIAFVMSLKDFNLKMNINNFVIWIYSSFDIFVRLFYLIISFNLMF